MLYVNEKSYASTLFKNTNFHVEKQLSEGQQKALELTGACADDIDGTLQEISTKLQNGMELSPSELEYLRKNAPDLYREAIKLIELRKKIEQRLSQCKSKEQVAKAQSEISSQIASECGVGASKKCSLQQAKMYERRINAANRCFKKFARTDNFRNLPDTDAEYVKLRAERLKEHFTETLTSSNTEEKSSDKNVDETAKADNPVEKTEKDKKLDAADNSDSKKRTAKSNECITLYTNDYRKESVFSSFNSGFNVKA